jgi:peptidylprolyl isomerase
VAIPVGCATVNYLKDATSPTRARALSVLATLGAGILIAGCGGSSGGSSTLTIGNENSADNKLVKAGEILAPATPTTGPLATEPTIAAGTGPTPEKLITKDVIVGTGTEARVGSTVYVNYVGSIWKTGKVFDASWKRHEPFLFVIGTGEVIEGWDKGVAGMKVGGRRILTIPSKLAYGSKGNPSIPPNTPLTFVVDMLKVSK